MPNNSNNMSHSFNYSHCKYYLEQGSTVQCYVSDQHILDEIYAYLVLSPLEWVISVIYVIVFITGLGGNFLVGYAVWRNKYLRTITNFFLTNLAVADFLTILFCLPPSFAQTIWETWFLGNVLCKIVSYLQNVSVIVSVLTLTCMSVERWFAICQPLTFKQTKSRVIMCVLGIWLIALVASIPSLIIMEEMHDPMIPPNLTILLTTCAPRDPLTALNYEIFQVVTFFGLPCAVMGYNYTAIAITLWASSTSSRCLTEGDQRAVTSQLMARRRTAKMLVVVVIVFFMCYMPNHVWNILRSVEI
ncbi:orexin receptor type 2 [Aplysia californica]|uniref:Orexin receptor type 2 n=1 Tax=Aplysia californica TaxID=6500 RepID=A0ABM1VX58_APLCA|nr:orexin receptor type 2 [Aplysia californica]